MASNYLLDEERIVRFVPWSKLRRDENDNVLGVLPQAFELRDGEEYLSVTWCEYFSGNPDESLRCAFEAIRGSGLSVKAKTRFAIAQVGRIKAAAKDRLSVNLRVIHEPEEDNAAHAAVRRWPQDQDEFLQRIAEDEWSELVDVPTMQVLPLTACGTSARADG